MSVEEYTEKRENLQFIEAKRFVRMYYDRYGCYPKEELLDEYFMIFSRNAESYPDFRRKINLCKNSKDSIRYMNEHEPMFENSQSFLEECFKDK